MGSCRGISIACALPFDFGSLGRSIECKVSLDSAPCQLFQEAEVGGLSMKLSSDSSLSASIEPLSLPAGVSIRGLSSSRGEVASWFASEFVGRSVRLRFASGVFSCRDMVIADADRTSASKMMCQSTCPLVMSCMGDGTAYEARRAHRVTHDNLAGRRVVGGLWDDEQRGQRVNRVVLSKGKGEF